ncbi:MAG: serine hydrolase [Fidelibacterota bacterium]|nr:MAG: serine hydrolase [Candidatus Neomarinimicrobiota bacterium]
MTGRTLFNRVVVSLAAILLLSGCATLAVIGGARKAPIPVHLESALPAEVGAETSNLVALLNAAVEDSAWPGGILLAARDGKIFIHEAFGYHTYARQRPTARGDVFDLASVTKVVATTSAVMRLVDSGHIRLADKVVSYLPKFSGPDQQQTRLKEFVTVRHLLTHASGLPPFRPFYRISGSVENRLDSVYATPLDTLPETRYSYSDIGLILLGKLVESVTGQALDAFVDGAVFEPLGMNSTCFKPPDSLIERIVPTEVDAEGREGVIRGTVHDGNAFSLGGVAGHAGLFSTAADLAVFSQMMLNWGVYRDSLIFQPETVQLFTRRANLIKGSSRCLGWDSPAGEASAGVYASSNSYGHTGYTGTSLWIDPDSRLIVILLTNAVHPNREWKDPKYFDWRQRIHSAVYECFPRPRRNPELELKARWASGSQ